MLCAEHALEAPRQVARLRQQQRAPRGAALVAPRAPRRLIAPAGGCVRHRARGACARAAPPDSDRASLAPVGERGGSSSSDGAAEAVDIGAAAPGTHLECMATGMDVACMLEPDKPGGKQQQQQQGQQGGPGGGGAGEADAAADAAPLEQLLSMAFLIAPFFLWGTTMAAMRPVTLHTTPLLMGALRLLPGGIALVAWAASKGRPQPSTATAWAWVAAFALVDGAMFQGFLAEGLQRTSAGLGSVIIDSQPLTVAVLAALLFDEKLAPPAVAGLFIGVAGLLLLEVPEEAAQQLLSQGPGALVQWAAAAPAALSGGSLWDSGEWWMLLAAQSMAVGTVMVRWVMRHCDPVMATGWHMVLGGAGLLALSLATDQPELAERLPGFSLSDAAAMGYGSLLGGAAAYGIFFYNATRGSLTALSSLTFLTPMFAAGAGYLALGETLTPIQLSGAAVTLFAVYLINGRPAK
ncbi:MAG: Drug/Metabolite transporter superfamily [Monoraphidium minutum]|nr:MAG: Drug/Metabolite transporter superfamily [Monoraphidium minutum]